jgi:SAM-dependent methyltransferase
MDYLAEQEDVIRRNVSYARTFFSQEPDLTRITELREFVQPHDTVLNVGCGPALPLYVKTTTALDISPLSERYLRAGGWPGVYAVGDCRSLPFPDKSFSCAICSEVVEHLPLWEDIVKTVCELDRVARSWMLTTPNKKIPEPTHKWVISEGQMRYLAGYTGAKFYRKSVWWFLFKKSGDMHA